MKISLDSTDKKIIDLLQQDADLSLAEIAQAVHLTTTPCWKRLKRMQDAGVVRKKVALLDADKLGLSFVAFALIKTSNHSNAWYQDFVAAVSSFPEVMEFYRMAGEYDYMLKVVVTDMPAYDFFYKKLVNSVAGISDVTSTFAMEKLKYTTQLPLTNL